MKICFQILSLNASGGAEKVLSSLASSLSNRGHDVSVVCLPREGKATFYTVDAKVKIYYIDGWDDEPGLTKWSKKLRNARRTKLLYKMLKKIRPDVSVSFLTDMTIYSAWAAKQANIPHISCERNSPWDKPEKEEKRIKRNNAFAVSTGCVVQTEAIKEYFDEDIQSKTIVIPNPVTLTCEPILADMKRENRIVSVGRLSSQKNQILLIKAFYAFHQTHPEYTLELYGKDFGEKCKLDSLIKALDLEKSVHIYEPIQELHYQIRMSKMFVMTSSFEGYPNALAEAISLGIPSISTDCSSKGPWHILNGGNRGILVPLDDCNALVRAMNLIVTDSEKAQQFSERGIIFGQNSTIEKYVDAWEEAIKTFKCFK